MKLQDSGVFAIEIEIVPFKVAELISTNIDVFMIGMGSGLGCDAQYLFAEDILGYNTGHIPRHAKVYTDVGSDYKRILEKSEKALKMFKLDVEKSKYPSKDHEINIPENELSEFVKIIKN